MRATRRHSAHFHKGGLSVSTRTVRWRISDGTIPAYTIGRRGSIRSRLDELEAAMRRWPQRACDRFGVVTASRFPR